jgi:DNA polymerase-4
MDAFYAAVEQLDDPALRGRPVLVGAASSRGVVLTASYEARPYGVGSAMPMAKARRLCPHAVIVPPRFDRYQEISRTIMGVFANFSPEVEALSLDEAFLDMTGAEQLFGDQRAMGRKLKDAVREATGLTVSVGLSATKYVAKVASGWQKPDGLTIVSPQEAKAWLAPLPISRLWGVGPKTEVRLNRIGFFTIDDIAKADPAFLTAELGSAGAHFHALAHATDPRPVLGRRLSKSIGSERTLEKDVRKKADIKLHLHRSAEAIGRRLRQKGYAAHGVATKLKTAEFQILTRQRRLSEPTDVTERLYSVAIDLLDEFSHPGPFRLVGMAAYDLIALDSQVQLDLFSPLARQRRLEVAIDGLAVRFGADVVHRASDLTAQIEFGTSPNLDFLEDQSLD